MHYLMRSFLRMNQIFKMFILVAVGLIILKNPLQATLLENPLLEDRVRKTLTFYDLDRDSENFTPSTLKEKWDDSSEHSSIPASPTFQEEGTKSESQIVEEDSLAEKDISPKKARKNEEKDEESEDTDRDPSWDNSFEDLEEYDTSFLEEGKGLFDDIDPEELREATPDNWGDKAVERRDGLTRSQYQVLREIPRNAGGLGLSPVKPIVRALRLEQKKPVASKEFQPTKTSPQKSYTTRRQEKVREQALQESAQTQADKRPFQLLRWGKYMKFVSSAKQNGDIPSVQTLVNKFFEIFADDPQLQVISIGASTFVVDLSLIDLLLQNTKGENNKSLLKRGCNPVFFDKEEGALVLEETDDSFRLSDDEKTAPLTPLLGNYMHLVQGAGAKITLDVSDMPDTPMVQFIRRAKEQGTIVNPVYLCHQKIHQAFYDLFNHNNVRGLSIHFDGQFDKERKAANIKLLELMVKP